MQPTNEKSQNKPTPRRRQERRTLHQAAKEGAAPHDALLAPFCYRSARQTALTSSTMRSASSHEAIDAP
ncbi:hypothetical protein P9857_16525, partial [Anoxybacillus geothermalis]|nr:hypothetical protein [Anoxybacillus geothermalis]